MSRRRRKQRARARRHRTTSSVAALLRRSFLENRKNDLSRRCVAGEGRERHCFSWNIHEEIVVVARHVWTRRAVTTRADGAAYTRRLAAAQCSPRIWIITIIIIIVGPSSWAGTGSSHNKHCTPLPVPHAAVSVALERVMVVERTSRLNRLIKYVHYDYVISLWLRLGCLCTVKKTKKNEYTCILHQISWHTREKKSKDMC